MEKNNNLFQFTFSQNGILSEYCRVSGRKAEDLINDFVNQNKDLSTSNKKANTEKFMKYIFSLRYPVFSRISGKFENIRNKVSDSNITVNTHEIFENPDITLTISIRDYNDLIKCIKKLEEKKEVFEDYFRSLEHEDIL